MRMAATGADSLLVAGTVACADRARVTICGQMAECTA